MIDVTEDHVLTGLRAWLLHALPDGTQVITGQQNMAPLPLGRVVVMTPLMQTALDVPTTKYNREAGTVSKRQSKDWRVQLDCYGDNAADAAAMLQTLFRTEIAFDWMAEQKLSIRPLWAEEPRNMAFINDAMNYENRWMLEVHLQVNPAVTVPQEFAEELKVDTEAVEKDKG